MDYLQLMIERNIDIRDFVEIISQGDGEMKGNIVSRYGVSLEYNKKGEIIKIFPTDNEKMFHNIVRKTLDVLSLDNQEQCVTSRILFSPFRTTGKYEISKELRIKPIPEGFPIPNQEVGDHPFVLEFFYSKSSNWMLNNKRISRKANKLKLILNLLINGGVKDVYISKHLWVITGDIQNLRSEYLQPGYWVKSDKLIYDGDNFTRIENIGEMEMEAFEDYFAYSLGIKYGSSLKLSNNFEQLFWKAINLPIDKQDIFYRSLYWYSLSSNMQNISMSSSFVALVNSIECMLKTKLIYKCADCGQDVYDKSISTAFKEFIDEYAPGIDKKSKNKFYSLRSDITHGKKILPQDEFSFTNSFSPNNFTTRSDYAYLGQIVRKALINWLIQIEN